MSFEPQGNGPTLPLMGGAFSSPWPHWPLPLPEEPAFLVQRTDLLWLLLLPPSRWPPAVGTSRFVPTIKLQLPPQNTSLFHDFKPHALLALHKASFPACTAGGDPRHPQKAHPLQTLPFPDTRSCPSTRTGSVITIFALPSVRFAHRSFSPAAL